MILIEDFSALHRYCLWLREAQTITVSLGGCGHRSPCLMTFCSEVLGLKPSASDKEIKMSYFQLAKKYHPDLNPDESAKKQFELISLAYETLSDDQKKQLYDN